MNRRAWPITLCCAARIGAVWLDVTTLLEQGPRPGKALQITNEAKDSLACEKTKRAWLSA